MDQQNWYGRLYDGKNAESTYSPFVGMDDKAYADFLRRKEKRERAIRDLVKEIDEFGAKTSYYINESGVLQLVHMAASYQLVFYCGDTAVVYVINTDMPQEAFQERTAFWESILMDSGIKFAVLTAPLMQGQFRQVIWSMEGNLEDSLKKLPYDNL